MSAMNHAAAWPRRRVRCILDYETDKLTGLFLKYALPDHYNPKRIY